VTPTPRKKKPIIAAVALAIALLALIAYSTLGLSKYKVEVCMDYQGQHACAITSASDKDHAIRAAIQQACADIVSGVTATMGCQAANPARITDLK
jgi:hypothetical protein